ncbi:DNA adenine methylase [uncultured Prevotella sp.]|uniref:DNA adenine methylase n=1 Tax=uncultured Prevotella sp. TaxID=159272 RepID=UPI00259AA636|nr:DNA adenine methylase [uncultured Prevotella sp.]
MKYGLPYKGSKNKLAERIVRLLPKRTHLIDLFCGGCAVSHAALLMGKYEHIHINDINWMCPTLFIDALNGKYNDENRWISREDFFRLKDTDPYVAVVWSFGNNLRDYLYSKEIEPLKKAIHYAMFFSDYSLGKELGHDLSFIDPIQDLQKRYLAVKHYFNRQGHFQQQSFEGGAESADAVSGSKTEVQLQSWNMGGARLRAIGKAVKSSLSKKKKYKRPSELQHNEGRNSVASLAIPGSAAQSAQIFRGGQILPITSSVLDYEEVAIPEDSVIYCDIPYEDTNVYNKAEGFDYERFYQWCERQTQPVFISSYQTPEDRFDCIEEFTHRSTLSATANNLVTERIYVPKHQVERGNRIVQLTLF